MGRNEVLKPNCYIVVAFSIVTNIVRHLKGYML